MNEFLLTWMITALLFVAVFVPYILHTQKKRAKFESRKQEALSLGHDRPIAQHPLIDQSQCIGCAACVIACPEHALGIIDGLAELVYPGKCVGHGVCAEACPVSGIRIVLDSAGSTAELPLLDESFQSNIPNLFLVGELGGMALIRNAIFQGSSVIESISELIRHSENVHRNLDIFDVIIAGAGPAGLSAGLTAKKNGLRYIVLEKEPSAGGAILSYPRQKLIMTTSVEIPLYGLLRKRELSKENLLSIWKEILAKTNLEVRCNEKIESVFCADHIFTVTTLTGHSYHSRYVVLALGRRGTPKKLNVPGEELPKVAYQLLETVRYQHVKSLVVGAGDSAIEAAIGLSGQTGAEVTLVNRGADFHRAKPKNRERIENAVLMKKVAAFYDTTIREIREKDVFLDTPDGMLQITNDYVFIFVGGEMPTPFLKKIGIEFIQKFKVIAE